MYLKHSVLYIPCLQNYKDKLALVECLRAFSPNDIF